MQPVISSGIEIRANRSGQSRAFIAGTRVRVLDVYALAELQSQSPDQIVDAFPHLTLSQVHAALSHYFANRMEIVSQFNEEESLGKISQGRLGPGPLEGKLSAKAFRNDSTSP